MKKITIAVFSCLFLMMSCKKNTETKTEVEPTVESKAIKKTFAEKIEIAHKKSDFLKHEAIQFDADVTFGGKKVFDATVTISTSSDIAKITYENGDEMYVNQQELFVSPGLKENPGVRFHGYTWSYFFLFPYKLNDAGTKWNNSFKTQEQNNSFNTAKLSFEANVGDAPDDWYVVYTNKENNMLAHVAYIVTAGKTVEEAEADPHAIKYLDYQLVNNIPFATNWDFYEWNNKEGLTNVIGNAKITNIKFVSDFRANFSIPKDYIKK